MSMFDWYRPAGGHVCPVCRTPLLEWQGKDGACALYVWEQGIAGPIDQACDEECRGSAELMAATRLPESFTIYSNDCGRHFVAASCQSVDGIWTETHVEPSVYNLKSQ
jgi:uncharacterized protein YbaR (Trm112 family)